MPKYPIIGLVVMLVSLAMGFAGKIVFDVLDDILVAAFLVFVGLMGVLSGGMIMRWGVDRR